MFSNAKKTFIYLFYVYEIFYVFSVTMLSRRFSPVPGPMPGNLYSGSKNISSVLARSLDWITNGFRDKLSVTTFSSSNLHNVNLNKTQFTN